MTLTDVDGQPIQGPRRVRRSRMPRVTWQQLLVVIISLIGTGVMVYPSATAWFSARVHDTEVDGYVQTVTENGPVAMSRLFEEALAYNARLPEGPLRDAYSLAGDDWAATDDYPRMLRVEGSDAMARIRIPSISVDLPVYHGTSDQTLARGVGHLLGTSLPTGGIGSHSVLSAHTGFVGATLFDDLDKVHVGDLVIIDVAGQTLYYRVDQALVLLPTETEVLQRDPSRDYLSLVTCTPLGVNSHRLVVRAARTTPPPADEIETRVFADLTGPAGFPWWALALVGVPLGAFLVLRTPSTARRSRK